MKTIKNHIISLCIRLAARDLALKVDFKDGKTAPIYIDSESKCSKFLSSENYRKIQCRYSDIMASILTSSSSETSFPTFSVLMDEDDQYWNKFDEDRRKRIFNRIWHLKKFKIFSMNFLDILCLKRCLVAGSKVDVLSSIFTEMCVQLCSLESLQKIKDEDKAADSFKNGVIAFIDELVKNVNRTVGKLPTTLANVVGPALLEFDEANVRDVISQYQIYTGVFLKVNKEGWKKTLKMRASILNAVRTEYLKMLQEVYQIRDELFLNRPPNDQYFITINGNRTLAIVCTANKNYNPIWKYIAKDGEYLCILFKKCDFDAIGVNEDAKILPRM